MLNRRTFISTSAAATAALATQSARSDIAPVPPLPDAATVLQAIFDAYRAQSWTSPEPALRCGIATVNVPGIERMDLEHWLWRQRRIRIRGGEPSKLRLSTPYYLLRRDVERYLEGFDAYVALRGIGTARH